MSADPTARALGEQQAELAAFGQRAAAGEDLQALLTDAAREAAASLGVQFVKVLEYRPDEKDLLVRAGIGWDEGVIGHATVGAEIKSPAGYALQTGEPVISSSLQKEERFKVPQLLKDHGVQSAVNVIIKNQDNVFGVLEADSRHPEAFVDEDVKFLQGYANILAFVIEQNKLVEQNAHLAKMQQMFFEELQHRVKNNNQQLLSLINLQLSAVTNIEARDNLEKIATRILALSRINEQLVSHQSPDRIELSQYLMKVVASLFDFHRESAAGVRLESEVETLDLKTAEAQALGLIVNEFLTNSFKHGFSRAESGTFRLEVGREDDAGRLVLSDDGGGLPEEPAPGLGFRLIDALVGQIEGRAKWSSEPGNGTRLEVTFPLLPQSSAASRHASVDSASATIRRP